MRPLRLPSHHQGLDTFLEIALVWVVLGSARTFSKAPPVDEAGLGTRGDAAFALRVSLGEAAQCHLPRCSIRIRGREHADYC